MGHKVLFVDVGDSTLAPMATAFARRSGLEADSAGTMPAREVSPATVLALREHGVDLRPRRPQRVDFRRLGEYERIITLGSGVAVTSPDLHAHEAWEVDDPVNLDFAVYRRARDEVESRVNDLAREIREWSFPPQPEEAQAPAHS